jgi:hypothetical protein
LGNILHALSVDCRHGAFPLRFVGCNQSHFCHEIVLNQVHFHAKKKSMNKMLIRWNGVFALMAMSLAACGSQAAPIHLTCDIDPQLSSHDPDAAEAVRNDICEAIAERITEAAPSRPIIHDRTPASADALMLKLDVTSVALKSTADRITAEFTWRQGEQSKSNTLTMTVVDARLSPTMYKSLVDALWAENQPPL